MGDPASETLAPFVGRAGLALACLLGGSTPLAAQTRVFTRSELPPSLRESLRRGELVRVSPAGVDTVAAAGAVSIRRGELLAARVGDSVVPLPARAAAPAGPDIRYSLPYTYLGFDSTGEVTTAYRPTYVPQGPLRYRGHEDDFAGTFLLGLQDSASPRLERQLASPIRIRFGGDADSIAPSIVELTRTNSQLEQVRVIARGVRDSVRILLVPLFDPRGVTVWLPVQPALAFEQTPARIQGFGVGAALLVLGTRGVLPRDSVAVTMSASRGSLESSRVFVGDAGGLVKVRSSGLGADTIRAVAPGFQTARTTIVYGWPVLFVTAALAGGLLGGLVAGTQIQKRPASSLPGYAVKGLLAGVAVSAVYFGIGLNLLQFDVKVRYFNEIAVFALAVLAGMFGIPALSPKAEAESGARARRRRSRKR